VVDFDAGQRLHFLFHSDGSNVAWGYKFKVSVQWLIETEFDYDIPS